MSTLSLDRLRVERKSVADCQPVVITLPMPPSTNNLFANSGHGRFPTRKYREWRDAAGLILNAAKPKRVPGRVQIAVILQERVNSDLDNRLKALLDLLVNMGVIDGDDCKYVRRIEAEWGDVQGCQVTISRLAA